MSLPLSTDALVQAIGWALVHLVWQASLAATFLAVVLALLPGRRGDLRYGLCCLTLVLVVALGIATGIRSSHAPQARPGAIGAAAAMARPIPPLGPAVSSPARRPARMDRLEGFVRAANAALPRVVVIWLAGVALFSARLLVDWLRVRRLLTTHAVEAPEPWPGVARRLSRRLGIHHAVRVLQSAAVEVPSVIGLVRPAVLIPASTLTGLSPAQLEMILAHELAHVRRHDFLVNLLQAVVETLLFYHPAVWWISRQVRIERENCCDDLAVATCGNRLEYARALLQLEELRAARPALAMSLGGGSLFERIRRICQRPMSTSGPAARAAGALAVQICLVAALAVPSLSALGRTAESRARHALAASAIAPSERPASLIASAISGSLLLASREQTDPDEPADDTPDLDAGDGSDAPAQIDRDADEDDADADADREADARADREADADRTHASEKPTIDELIQLRVQNVSAADIEEMRSLFPKVSLSEIAGMKAVGATPRFVRGIRAAGLAVRSSQEAQGLAALGVTRGFVQEMRSVGFPVLTASEAQGLKAVGVTPSFVRGMRSAGLTLTPEGAQGLAALGATPDYVEDMRRAGVKIDEAEDVQSLRAMGITSEFVRKLARAGYTDLSVQDLCGLGAAGVNGDFIREMSRYRSR